MLPGVWQTGKKTKVYLQTENLNFFWLKNPMEIINKFGKKTPDDDDDSNTLIKLVGKHTQN